MPWHAETVPRECARLWASSDYNTGVKLIVALFAFFGVVLLVALPVAAQIGTSGRLTPQKFCSSSDNSLECVSQRNQANIDRYVYKYKDETRQQKEKLETAQAALKDSLE
jgi:hypothetical protein